MKARAGIPKVFNTRSTIDRLTPFSTDTVTLTSVSVNINDMVIFALI